MVKTCVFLKERGVQSKNLPNTEVGDYVEQDEEIATIETDKVSTFI